MGDSDLENPTSADYHNPTAAYLVPLLGILGTALLTGALSSGSDRLYPLRVLVAAIALWSFRRYYADLRLTWSSDRCRDRSPGICPMGGS